MKAYGHDFGMVHVCLQVVPCCPCVVPSCTCQRRMSCLQSKAGAELMYKYPILLDACANEMQRKGDSMMAKWAEVMTCLRPKSYFLRPDVAIPLGLAVVREMWNQKIVGRPDLYKKGF